MPDIVFVDGKSNFATKHHGNVTLSKSKWETICREPERRYYAFNGEKVATTLINPDQVRHHKIEKNQFLYYKKFSTMLLAEQGGESRFGPIFFTVVIDTVTKKICTVYPTAEPKPGKAFVPQPKGHERN